MFKEVDDGYKESVNGNMCNDFCVCAGKDGDPHYKQYKDIDEKIYAKFKRSWGSTSDPDLTEMIFAEGDPAKTSQQVSTVADCIGNSQDIVTKIGEFAAASAKAQGAGQAV